jgi:4-carboxymuconolactone decarboxylase
LEGLREVLLQTYLFAGFPKSINALSELALLDTKEPSGAIDLEEDLGKDAEWIDRGQALCRRVYGASYDRLLASMARLSPDLGRWMISEGYGKVLSRPGLDARERELAAIGALVVLHVPEQLKAHVRGAMLVGASHEDVLGAIEAAGLADREAVEPARSILDAAIRSRERGGSSEAGSEA